MAVKAVGVLCAIPNIWSEVSLPRKSLIMVLKLYRSQISWGVDTPHCCIFLRDAASYLNFYQVMLVCVCHNQYLLDLG